jgi:hypothetical protein
MISDLVARDGEKPRWDRAIAFPTHAADRPSGCDQSFLDYVIEVGGGRAQLHRDEPVNHRQVLLEQCVERLSISILGSFKQLISGSHSGGV